MQFSANLGLLWSDRALSDAIRAAAQAGFHAVECHWPYSTPSDDVLSALSDSGLPMLGLNTSPGDLEAGEFGLSALPGREAEARAAIDQAIEYACAVKAQAVHVMAGKAHGAEAEAVFCSNLAYACSLAAPLNITVLIEPLNGYDVPGYFLNNTAQASRLIGSMSLPNLKLMFDCYHVARQEGDVAARLGELLPIIGHIQFASVPERGPPDQGALCYEELFSRIKALGYVAPLGAEYRPEGATDASLDWLARFGD